MKKYLIFFLIVSLTLSMLFLGAGCKKAAPVEEVAEEETVAEEASTEEAEEEVATVEEATAVEVPGVTDDQIKVGSSVILSGDWGKLGMTSIDAIQLCFDKYNKEGGIFGRKIEYIFYDSTMDPANDIANYRKLIQEDEVFTIFYGMFFSVNAVYNDLIEKNGIPYLFPIMPSTDMVFPPRKYLFTLFPTPVTQIKPVVKWLSQEGKFSDIGIIYSNSQSGIDALNIFKDEINGSNIKVVAEEAVEEPAVSVAVQVAKLKEANPDLVMILNLSHEPIALIVKEARKIGWDVKIMMPNLPSYTILSLLSEEEAKGLLGSYPGKLINTIMDDPESYTPEMKEAYDRIIEAYPDAVVVEGMVDAYLNTELFIEALKRAGENLTREGLIEALESFDSYDFGKGAPVTYSKTRREGIAGAFIVEAINNKQWVEISDWIEADIDESQSYE